MNPTGSHNAHRGKRTRHADEPRRPAPPHGHNTGAVSAGMTGGAPGIREQPPAAPHAPAPALGDRVVRPVAPAAGHAVARAADSFVSVAVNGEVLHERALLADDTGNLVTRPPGHASSGLVAHDVGQDVVVVFQGPVERTQDGVPERVVGLIRLDVHSDDIVVDAADAVANFRRQVHNDDIEASVGFAREWMEVHVEGNLDRPAAIKDLLQAFKVRGSPPRGADEDTRSTWIVDQVAARHAAMAQEVAEILGGTTFELPHEGVFVAPSGQCDTFRNSPTVTAAPAPRRPAAPLPLPLHRHREAEAEPDRAARDIRERHWRPDSKLAPAQPEPGPVAWSSSSASAATAVAGLAPARREPRADRALGAPFEPAAGTRAKPDASALGHAPARSGGVQYQFIETGRLSAPQVLPMLTGAGVIFETEGRVRCVAHSANMTRLRAEIVDTPPLVHSASVPPRITVVCDASLLYRDAWAAYHALFRSAARLRQFQTHCEDNYRRICMPEIPAEVIRTSPAWASESDKVHAVIAALMRNHAALVRAQAVEMNVAFIDVTGMQLQVDADGRLSIARSRAPEPSPLAK